MARLIYWGRPPGPRSTTLGDWPFYRDKNGKWRCKKSHKLAKVVSFKEWLFKDPTAKGSEGDKLASYQAAFGATFAAIRFYWAITGTVLLTVSLDMRAKAAKINANLKTPATKTRQCVSDYCKYCSKPILSSAHICMNDITFYKHPRFLPENVEKENKWFNEAQELNKIIEAKDAQIEKLKKAIYAVINDENILDSVCCFLLNAMRLSDKELGEE